MKRRIATGTARGHDRWLVAAHHAAGFAWQQPHFGRGTKLHSANRSRASHSRRRSKALMTASRNVSTPSAYSPGSAWTSARSEEHTSELQSLMRISYAVFCLKKKKKTK